MSPFEQVVAAVDRFLAGGEYMAFWSAIDGPGSLEIDLDSMSEEESAAFDRIHDLAAYGQEDDASADEAAVGLIGGEELRRRVQEWRASLGPVRQTAPVTLAVRRAAASDAPALSRLAATTFRETFEHDNTPEDMAAYLAEAFTPERQTAEIADPAGAVLVVELPGAEGGGSTGLVGYAHLVASEAPAAVQGPAPLELKRIYVAQAWHGQGVAQALLAAALDAARALSAQTLWLGVWERNPRAIAFYAKHGFERVGDHVFVLGDDIQTDWLLARPVALPVAPARPV